MSISHVDNQISEKSIGQLSNGQEIVELIMQRSNGFEARILNYGGILTSLRTPDRHGTLGEITLGYDDLSGYLNDETYMGALIGRYANRIADGSFTLNGQQTNLSCNEKGRHLHGGVIGFNRIVWDYEIVNNSDQQYLKLHHFSPDKQEGYPGNLDVDVSISLEEINELHLIITAKTDQISIFNPTYHPYFNLNNNHQTGILNHVLQIDAKEYLPITSNMLPVGDVQEVFGTVFDFLTGATIGDLLDISSPQIAIAGGYDNCFVLSKNKDTIRRVAKVYSPESGRCLTVLSDAPGLQFYSGNFLNLGSGTRSSLHGQYKALCLEPQSYPNAPNVGAFPSTLIHPGEEYRRTIIYQCSLVDQCG